MPITENAEALAEFARLVQPAVCPTLDETTEQQVILNRHKRGTVWKASTATAIGDRVIPNLVNRNGHRYRAVEYTDTGTDQKTAATEPIWPTTRDAQVTDNHVIWQEDGYDWNAILWDFNAAARDGWLMKASKASVTSDVARGELDIKSSQLFDHCMAMADTFQVVYLL